MKVDRNCQGCPRLVEWRAAIRARYPDYHAAPVLPFGPRNGRLLIVGLAPGLHGGNRWGRPFTGDASARTLIGALARAGFANQADSTCRSDGLRLLDARLTNAVKCVPPANRPTAAELASCNVYLRDELRLFARRSQPRCVLALGQLAHRAVMHAFGEPSATFRHGALHRLNATLTVVDCYHPSRLNVNTRKLSDAMLDAVLEDVRAAIEGPP